MGGVAVAGVPRAREEIRMPLQHLDTVIAFAVVMLLLSLLVTVLVQMVVTALYLRGKNLLWATRLLVTQIDPELGVDARNLAERVLRHPALSRAGHTLAVAMRKQELVLALDDIRKRRGGGEEEERLGLWRRLLRRAMRRLKGISSLGPPALAPATYERLDKLFTQVVREDAPELTAKAEELLERLEAGFPEQARDLRGVVEATYRRTQDVVLKVDAWFDTVMDRSSDRFKGWSRAITAGVSLALAFGLHIDSLALIHQLSADGELRSALVRSADEVLTEAGEALPHTGEGAEAQIGTRAIRAMAVYPGAEDVARLVREVCAREAASAAGGGEAAATGSAGTCAPGLTTPEEGRDWLLPRVPPERRQEVGEAYDLHARAQTKAQLEELGFAFSDLERRLAETRLQIVPAGYCASPPPGRRDRFLYRLRCPFVFQGWRQVLGVLVSAVLLSLGAPFWFNVLRRLVDLRPIVARRAAGEPAKGAPSS